MDTISAFLGQDHKRCDEIFVQAEKFASARDFTSAAAACRDFLAAMEHHFGMEEHVLFPAFEKATGSSMGPTAVMRHEHEMMRGLFREMLTAINGQNAHDFLGASETLLILMQQHNAKEEQILYPAGDRMLQSAEIVREMREQQG